MKIPAQNYQNFLQEKPQNQSGIDFTCLEKIIDPHPLRVNPSMQIAEVIHLMSQHWVTSCQMSETDSNDNNSLLTSSSISCALVVSENQLQGIFTERDLVKLISNGEKIEDVTVAEVMTQQIITLKRKEFEDVFTTIKLMRRHRIRHLPVVDENNSLVGLVTTTKLRQTLQPSDFLRFRQVAEVMNTEVVHAPPRTNSPKTTTRNYRCSSRYTLNSLLRNSETTNIRAIYLTQLRHVNYTDGTGNVTND